MEYEKIIKQNKIAYDDLAEEYDKRVEKNEFGRIFSRILKNIKPGGDILDIGCGVGTILEILNSKGFKTTGIDFSERMAYYAKKRNPQSEIIVGEFLETKIERKFDAIFAYAFIHLFPNNQLEKVLKKIRFLLNDEGIAIFATTKHKVSSEGYCEKEDYKKPVKRFRRKFTKEELENNLEKHFEIVDYFEDSDFTGKIWMLFIVKNKKSLVD
jgi:2-polyprenyl-3-methyl-5-hydroxy-6-metoxy-1,4-benzoquinol methylase